MKIENSTLEFLNKIKSNNNRDWFNEHKNQYKLALTNVEGFADSVIQGMNETDIIETPSGKKSLFRIYRDVRFSKDKSPYKTHFGSALKRATKALRGGYYFHIEPGNSFLAGGFWGPNKEDLQRIREEIAENSEQFGAIISAKTFCETFGELVGDQVKTAPKGYSKNHPSIDLLRYKQYIVKVDFSDKEVLMPNFNTQVVDKFTKMRPFLDYMSEVLTTDSNGESII